MAGLQVGRALGCCGCLGLDSAVPAPAPTMFLGTQPPYATKALITCKQDPLESPMVPKLNQFTDEFGIKQVDKGPVNGREVNR